MFHEAAANVKRILPYNGKMDPQDATTALTLARMIGRGDDPCAVHACALALEERKIPWREQAVFAIFRRMHEDPSFIPHFLIDAILPLMHPEKPAHDCEWYRHLAKTLNEREVDPSPFFPVLLPDNVELSDTYLDTPNGKAGMEFVAVMLAQGILVEDGKHLKATLSHQHGCYTFAQTLLRNYNSKNDEIDLEVMQHMQQSMGGVCSPELRLAISQATALRTQDFLPDNGSWERKMERSGWGDSLPWQVEHGWLDRNIVQQTLEGILPQHRQPTLETKLLSALTQAQSAVIGRATPQPSSSRRVGTRL